MGTGLYPLLPSVGVRLLERRQGRTSSLTLRSAAAEWGTALASIAVRPTGIFGKRLGADSGQRPVILVHGYAMNRACFRVLARRLGEAGYGPIYGFEYWTLGNLASASRRLHEFIEQVCHDHLCTEVDLVGHSMGGLVARYYLTLGPGRHRGRVAHLVTLGTPHGGSIFSAFGIGRAQVELRPRTPLFQRMTAAPLPKSTQVSVIWSRADALVGSEEYARWQGCSEVVYDDLGHVSLLYSRRVAAEVIMRLRATVPQQRVSPSSNDRS